MDLDQASAAIKKMWREQSKGKKYVHRPVALIWAAQRAAQGEQRMAPWREIREDIRQVISALGGSASGDTAADEVMRLEGFPLIDFNFVGPRHSSPAQALEQQNPTFGLTDDAYQFLASRENFDEFAKIVVKALPIRQARVILDYFNVFFGFGEVPGVAVGTVFSNRKALSDHRVHINTQWGIVGTGDRGAESVVVSGGYEDDKDYGDVIVYTGHGGRDPDTGKQNGHQDFEARGNAALITSQVSGAPVRVIRGADPKKNNVHAPDRGYRYDGLFQVESFWQDVGKSGFRICYYRLIRVSDPVEVLSSGLEKKVLPRGRVDPGRRSVTYSQVVRERALSTAVKELHDHHCQICGIRLTVQGRGYAQGAHIRPIGRPHSGTDTPDNLLCLCPNCHILFDNGEIVVNDDLKITSKHPNLGALRVVDGHVIDRDNLQYHRGLFPAP